MFQHAKDVVLHVKNKIAGIGTVKKTVYPVTRWENVLGAPRLLNKTSLEDAFPSEYAIYEYRDISISDEEYEACFGEL